MTLYLETTVRLFDIFNMKSAIPLNIQLRLFLNEKGFLFQDDGKPSLIINKNPIPLGEFSVVENVSDMSFTFRQIVVK